VTVTDFNTALTRRIAEARRALTEARLAGEDYLVDVRLGELESMARVAAEHGVQVEGLAESLAEHGLCAPHLGAPLRVDVQDAALRTGHDGGIPPAREPL
jgi:hypothetical protein